MKVVASLAMRAAPWAIPVLTIGIFVCDVFAPAGVAVSIFYIVPLLVTVVAFRGRPIVYFCIVVTGLMWVDFVLMPPPTPIPYAALNRALGTFVFFGVTLGLIYFRRVQEGLVKAEGDRGRAEQDLRSERVERAHAEALMMAAQEARVYADTALLDAATSRQQAEDNYKTSRLQLEGIIQSAMDAIITVDHDQKIVLFNKAAEQMFQWSARDALGQPLDHFLPTRFRAAHREHVEAFGRSGMTNRKMGALGQVSGLRADGTEFPLEAAISHLEAEGRRYFTVILRDIAGRKRAEEALTESERVHRTLLSNLSGMAYRCQNDRDWTMEFVSDGCEAITGYPPRDIMKTGRLPFNALIYPEDQQRVWDQFQESINNRLPCSIEYRIKTAAGEEKWVLDQAQGIFTHDGDLQAVEGYITDITQSKRLHKQLQDAQRLAELGTLASGMAHEIGTPMNVILGRAEYLIDRVKDEPIKKGLQTIVAQVERITKVMNQLLAFARRKPPERGPLALKAIVEDSLELFQERLSKSRVTVELAFDDGCPMVEADADQMSQVLVNLIMNALHAMENGGTVRIGLAPEEDKVKLTVADTGDGISPETAKKIFEPFFTTKEFGKGTGLGLTVVKGIIEEHKGAVTVASDPGKGTTFTIVLPVCQAGAG